MSHDCPADGEMTMPKPPVRAATDPDPRGWRAATVRVLANALLVLFAFEGVTLAATIVAIGSGWTMPVSPVELAPLMAVFLLVRWVVVLPGMLPVLVGLEYVARRVPHPRVLTAIVAFTPMVWWELSQSPEGFSAFGAILGVTAVLFAVLARLPTRVERRPPDDRGATETPAMTLVAPR